MTLRVESEDSRQPERGYVNYCKAGKNPVLADNMRSLVKAIIGTVLIYARRTLLVSRWRETDTEKAF